MQSAHVQRSAGWAILAYIAVLVSASFLTNGLPALNYRPTDAAVAIDSQRYGLLWGAWLTFPASAFFLWFLVGLRRYLSNGGADQEDMSMLAFASGIVMVAMSLVAATFLVTAAHATPAVFETHALSVIFDAFFFVQGGLGY
ncbi:MAG: hypothetical protein JO113_03635, partial [Candidatus Eremiobacteraeota bacterium]|nr:hypothetical protein [Candidatus Eremiobacteraeota bacterium]